MSAESRYPGIYDAVIPAAGRGTRMFSLTGGGSKELLEISGKPLIQYTLQEAVSAGVRRIILILNKRKKDLADYLAMKATVIAGSREYGLDELAESGISVEYIYQDDPRGLAHAVSLAEDCIRGNDFLLLLPDNFFQGELSPSVELLKTRIPGRSCVGILRMTAENRTLFSRTSAVELERIQGSKRVRILKIGSKHKNNINTADTGFHFKAVGRAVYSSDFFESYRLTDYPDGAEHDDVPVLQTLVRYGKIDGCILESTGFDAGNPEGFAAARYWNK